jgi:hypothetical protein
MKFIMGLFIILLFACNLKETCERTEVARIDKVTCLKEMSLGQTAGIEIEFGIGNGCGSFKEIKSVQTGNYLNIEVINAFTGCTCTEIYQMGTKVFQFTPTQKGTYYIQYLLNENSLTTDTLLVK